MIQRRAKYNAKPTTIDGYRFDSHAEARRYAELMLMEKAGEISGIKVHPKYELQDSFIDRNDHHWRSINYVADFSYRDNVRMVRVVEDVKGARTALFRLKEKLFRFKYPMIELRILEV